jgi:pimeloyl-ACP methyl ester carboxylesterase
MRKVELRVDVTTAAALGRPQVVAGTAYLPDKRRPDRPVVVFASPGGGYSRNYFDMHFPRVEGYSEAQYHTSRGFVFVAHDHLGVGDSSIDAIDELRVETIADAAHAFVRNVVGQLRQGTLDPALAPVVSPFVLGIGQSMGGGITLIMQGRHRTFDAIVPLGISAIHTTLPQRTAEQHKACRDIFMFSRQTPLEELLVSVTGTQVPDFLYPFHWDDEPPEVRDADLSGGYPLRQSCPPFGSSTVPRCAVAMNSPGFFTPEVARIDVPVLMAYGERDVSHDMRREPTAFMSSNDVSVFIVPRMAHMHNFADTRHILWQRVADWAEMQARSQPP